MKNMRPTLHVTPKAGWINDPNGFSYAFGQYHIFAQHNPLDTKWGPMHWIHFVSKDLIQFEEVGIALKPDQSYDHLFGCFSGSALEVNNQHLLFYTGAIEGKQQQCFAVSNNGRDYIKPMTNPIIAEDNLPEEFLIADFRDPYVFIKDGIYYLLVSARKKIGGSAILMYKTSNLSDYQFVGVSLETGCDVNEMIECPSVFFDKGQTVLLYSLQFKKSSNEYQFQNIHSTLYVIGEFDFITGRFISKSEHREIDSGFDFYAPQTMTRDGKHYMIAWANMWDRQYPSSQVGYVGQLTMVRQISIENGRLIQHFPSALANYYQSNLTISQQAVNVLEPLSATSATYRLKINLTLKKELKISLVEDDSVAVILNPEKRLITFVRGEILNVDETSTRIRKIKVEDEMDNLNLELVVDNCSLEMLINDGKQSFTMTFFTQQRHRLKLESKDETKFGVESLVYNVLNTRRNSYEN